MVVVGASGTEDYGKMFQEWMGRWEAAAKRAKAEFISIGVQTASSKSDYEELKQRVASFKDPSDAPLWLILIGHGTFDGKTARFNLKGRDVSLSELADWLKQVKRPLAILNCASCSGPFLSELSGPNRIVITATKSGHEYNFARFGNYLSSAIGDPRADLDKDDQTSLLEAFLMASARVNEFYTEDNRLMTEHALLDDNGDRLGTPADWFQGVRAVKSAKNSAAVDGKHANQWHLIPGPLETRLTKSDRERRDSLEQHLDELRRQKSQLAESDYLKMIEPIVQDLAELYERAEKGNSK